jgi:hypothetical protein
MVILKVLVLAIAAVVVLVILARNTGRWAHSLQEYYIAQSKNLYGHSGGWDKSWRLTLLKALVIFFGLMAILGVYVVMFSAFGGNSPS